jgi:hypothetical protein
VIDFENADESEVGKEENFIGQNYGVGLECDKERYEAEGYEFWENWGENVEENHWRVKKC